MTKKNKLISLWGERIQSEVKIRKTFRDRIKLIERIYSGKLAPYDSTTGQNSPEIDYNILWVNSQIMLAALYSQNPRPDVRRRYKDPDNQLYNEAGKEIAIMLERGLSFTQDVEDYFGNASNSVLSFVKFACGQMRVKYVPVISKGMPTRITILKEENGYVREDNRESIAFEQIEQVQMDEQGGFYLEQEGEENLEHEELQPEWIPISRFHWEPVADWKNVSWAVIDHFLTYDELVDQFGEEKALKIPLSYTDSGEKAEDDNSEGEKPTRALVRECFDKRKLKVQIYAEGCDEVLIDEDDPYELTGFYPFPKPMLGTMGDDGLNPVPDYIYYQDQHAELNTITDRINTLLKAVKYRGVYDGSFSEMANMSTAKDGEFKAISNFAEMAAASGTGKLNLNDFIAEMPIANAAALLDKLYQYREQVVKVIYEITGISDIVRGSSKASETLGAQELKSQYANLRLQTKQKEVERFFRDIMRIQSEFLAEKFDSDTLEAMTGMTLDPQLYEVMGNDLLRSFIVDVETDSTVLMDSAREQKERIEAIQSLTGMIAQLAPLAQMGLPPQVIGQLVMFGLKGFKGARELEDVVQDIMDAQPQAMPMPMAGEEMMAEEVVEPQGGFPA